MANWRFFIAALMLQAIAALPAAAEKRVALVIGNSAYKNAARLSNPVNDANDTAKLLTKFGFNVILGLDLARPAFEEKVRAFSRALENADTAVLYYAGHGLQLAGRNYLVPVDATLGSERDLDFEAIPLDFVLKQMEVGRDGKTNIVFLDACRDNPLARNLARSMGTRSASVGKGLAEVQTGVGTFIAYSTQPGNVALDGEGRNSPFASAFVKRAQEPGHNLTAIMIGVRKDVLAATGGRQVPWDHSALTGDFYFQPGASGPYKEGVPRAGVQTAQNNATTIADLDALAAAESWAELYGRLTSISPAARDAHWNNLVEQTAIGELTAQTGPGGSAAERLAAIERYYPKFPSLKTSAKFLALRTTVGLEAFKLCMEGPRDFDREARCFSDLERFVHAVPPNAELALGAAHVARLRFQSVQLFYATGVDAPGGQAICADAPLQADLVRALELPPDYRETKAALVVMEKCWDAVKSAVVANVAKEVGESYYMQNACPALIQHKSLMGLREKRCQLAIKH